ncbi:hypothetical protein C21_03867 [Arenibacter sp. NBRC 103722]|nr:hypothetical protein C21_03867 [Arenibacter sp. NBRC 103722]
MISKDKNTSFIDLKTAKKKQYGYRRFAILGTLTTIKYQK